MNDISFVLDGGLRGGAERVALNLISFWVADGRKVSLITLSGPEEDFYIIKKEFCYETNQKAWFRGC